jgi:hypothetical protein
MEEMANPPSVNPSAGKVAEIKQSRRIAPVAMALDL